MVPLDRVLVLLSSGYMPSIVTKLISNQVAICSALAAICNVSIFAGAAETVCISEAR